MAETILPKSVAILLTSKERGTSPGSEDCGPFWFGLRFGSALLEGPAAGAAFGGVGDVEPELRDFAFRELLFSGGAGLRLTLSEKERTQIRFDFGVGSGGTTGFYLQFRESF